MWFFNEICAFSAIFWTNWLFPMLNCRNSHFFRDPLKKFTFFRWLLDNFAIFLLSFDKIPVFLQFFDEICVFLLSFAKIWVFLMIFNKILIFPWFFDRIHEFSANLQLNSNFFYDPLTKFMFILKSLYEICIFFKILWGKLCFFHRP